MATQPNYSPELVAKITADYESGTDIEQISKDSGKSVRSLRAKLSQLGVYKTASKNPTKSGGVTREKIVRVLEETLNLTEDSLSSLESAKKGELEMLLQAVKS